MKAVKSAQVLQTGKETNKSRRVLYETVAILTLTFIAQFLWRDYSLLVATIPTIYLFIERSLRQRTWKEIGFNFRAIPKGLAANWFLILLVSIIIQFSVFWISKTWMPAFLAHLISRLPLTISQTMTFLPLLLVGTLWEEINYRALFQERLNWFIPTPAAIVIVSILFGIGHYAAGDPRIVAIDILLVVLDSLLYGLIFARSKNVFVSWTAHFLANFFAIGFFLFL